MVSLGKPTVVAKLLEALGYVTLRHCPACVCVFFVLFLQGGSLGFLSYREMDLWVHVETKSHAFLKRNGCLKSQFRG